MEEAVLVCPSLAFGKCPGDSSLLSVALYSLILSLHNVSISIGIIPDKNTEDC